MTNKRRTRKAERSPQQGFSRRGFLKSAGLGAAGLWVGRGEAAAAGEATGKAVAEGELTAVTLIVNQRPRELMVEPRWSLLHVLREELGLTGPKEGCHRGECGSCTVLIDDVTRYACLTLAVEAEGARVTTLEGLLDGEELGSVQQAFLEQDAFQCGFCTSGQIMAVEGLLRQNPDPSPEEVRVGISGNLCRCGAYRNIVRAAHRAAELERGAS